MKMILFGNIAVELLRLNNINEEPSWDDGAKAKLQEREAEDRGGLWESLHDSGLLRQWSPL